MGNNESRQAQDQFGTAEKQDDQGALEWMEEEEENELYLASANYSQDLGFSLTSEAGL